MKITLTAYYLPPTDRIGAGVQMHMLANAYCTLGHDVTVISPSLRCEADARYRLISIPLHGNNRTLQWARFLAQYVYDADFVHFSGDDFLVPKSSDFVHMRTFMGSCIAEARVASRLIDKARMLCLGLTEIVSSMRFPLTTVISNDTNRYLVRNGQLVPCGIDLGAFKPGPIKHHNPAILFVGTLDSRKRGRQLLGHFQQVVRRKIPNAELWIVRENEKVTLPGVTVFGSVTQERLVDLYQRAWVFCLPSSYEGFGVPYVEAMACGTPVVATSNPGAMEVLDGGRYGVIADIDKLGDELLSLLNNRDRREELTMLGLERADQYDIYAIAQQYINIVSNRMMNCNI